MLINSDHQKTIMINYEKIEMVKNSRNVEKRAILKKFGHEDVEPII